MVSWVQRWALEYNTGVAMGIKRGEKVQYIFLRLLGRVETKDDSHIFYFKCMLLSFIIVEDSGKGLI